MKTRQSSNPSSSRLRRASPSSPRLRRAGWGAKSAAILAAAAVIGLLGTPGRAEPTNYWTNSFGGDWNLPGNWTNTAGANQVPGVSNQACLYLAADSKVTVNYTNPMIAASIPALGIWTNVLNINAAGFVVDPTAGGYSGSDPVALWAWSEINVNSGGVFTYTNYTEYLKINGGTLNINGGTVNVWLNPPRGYLNFWEGGSVLNMNSGTLTVENYGIYVRQGDLNFRGGVINTAGLNIGADNRAGTVTMTNGTLITWRRSGVGGRGGGLSGADGPGTMTVSGGSITNYGSLEIPAGYSTGTLNISGGLWAQLSGDFYVGGYGNTSTVNISGTARFESVGILVGLDMSAGTYGALNISNGVFQATNATADALLNVKQGAVTLSGGTLRADKLILQDNALTNTLKFMATPGSTNMGVVNVVGALTISNAATAKLVVDLSQYTAWRTGVTSVLLVTYGTLSPAGGFSNVVVTPPPMPPMRITPTVDQTTDNRIQVNLRVPQGTVVSGR